MAVWPKEPEPSALKAHFDPTDPSRSAELTRSPFIRRLLRSRRFQFLFILPNQLIFWLVITAGLVGGVNPTRNFSTVITWYIWFCVVFLLMVGIGRAWCLMCPFGGFAEWVQRLTFWSRHPRAFTLGRKWSASLSRYGILPSVGVFLILTFFEEYFGIAGPGTPKYTSFLVLGVISLALLSFLLLERRTFCRYICPLTALIGTVGATGMVSGARTRNRDVCVKCTTKDCMRGSERGYACPWYEWPGSATSNLMCGLCTECFKSCPSDNIGFYAQKPLTSVIAPLRRRWDVAVAVLVLFGLVVFQQLNALPFYSALDDWLNAATHFPAYPNPLDFIAFVAAGAGVAALWIWLIYKALGKRPGTKSGGFTDWLVPLSYGLIPLMGSDYLARQLPKFWNYLLRIVPSISDPFDRGWNLFGTAHSPLYGVKVLSNAGVVHSQMIVAGIGAIAAVYATWRIARRDLQKHSSNVTVAAALSSLAAALAGVAVVVLYGMMAGAE